jgi:hypothetical protein
MPACSKICISLETKLCGMWVHNEEAERQETKDEDTRMQNNTS